MTTSGGETREDPSGWTTDTLRMYMQTQLDQLNNLLDERLVAQQVAMQTAFAAANEQFEAKIGDLRSLLDERYRTQTKAVDAAFQAQQLAMQTALTAAETAVGKALESAEKAVSKAELSVDKRLGTMNEFRGQLADQAREFMSRAEALAVNVSLSEKIDALATRQDRNEGRGAGSNATVAYIFAGISAIAAVIVIIISLRGGV